MRKSIKLLSALTAVLVMLGVQSCSKASKGDVLDFVPADASVIVYGDSEYIMSKSGLKDGKIGEPLQSALDQANCDYTEAERMLKHASGVTGDAAMFMKGNKLWVIVGLNNASDFYKYLEDEYNFDIEKNDGVVMATKKKESIMFRDNMMFMCYKIDDGKLDDDTSGVKDLCNLGDDSFAESDKTKELADGIKERKSAFFALANFGKLTGLIDDDDFSQFKATLSMAYSNPTYAMFEANINDDGATAELKVLDSDYKPAKSTLPLGSIDTDAFKYAAVPDNSMIAAIDLPAALIKNICTLASKFGVPSEMTDLISCINGTVAFTFNFNAATQTDMYALMLTANNNSDAVKIGNLVAYFDHTLKCSTADKYLRITLQGGPQPSGSTKYAEVLNGKPAGVVYDLSTIAKQAGLGGDLAQLGVLAIYADKSDKSLSLKAEWKCQNPVGKLFEIAKNGETIFDAINNFENKFYKYEPISPVDTTYYSEYDTGYSSGYSEGGYSDDYYEPEPDYLY